MSTKKEFLPGQLVWLRSGPYDLDNLRTVTSVENNDRVGTMLVTRQAGRGLGSARKETYWRADRLVDADDINNILKDSSGIEMLVRKLYTTSELPEVYARIIRYVFERMSSDEKFLLVERVNSGYYDHDHDD